MAEQKDEDDHKHWYDSKLEQNNESKDDIPKANAEAARLTLVHPGGEESPY